MLFPVAFAPESLFFVDDEQSSSLEVKCQRWLLAWPGRDELASEAFLTRSYDEYVQTAQATFTQIMANLGLDEDEEEEDDDDAYDGEDAADEDDEEEFGHEEDEAPAGEDGGNAESSDALQGEQGAAAHHAPSDAGQ